MTPDVDRLVAACERILDADTRRPPGYPDSLALCIVDAIWSMGVRYASVENVIRRYRTWVRDVHDHDPEIRSGPQLVADIDSVGGPEAFAHDIVDNRARTSSRSGILKAEAVRDAARELADLEVKTTADLRELHDRPKIEEAWRTVRGQRSGISWHYLCILTGVQDVKADRMICRFVAGALGRSKVAPSEARELLIDAQNVLTATRAGLDLRTLDHAIWSHQRRR